MEKMNILVANVPNDVIAFLDKKAEANYRSRNGEILAILTAVARGGVIVGQEQAPKNKVMYVSAQESAGGDAR